MVNFDLQKVMSGIYLQFVEEEQYRDFCDWWNSLGIINQCRFEYDKFDPDWSFELYDGGATMYNRYIGEIGAGKSLEDYGMSVYGYDDIVIKSTSDEAIESIINPLIETERINNNIPTLNEIKEYAVIKVFKMMDCNKNRTAEVLGINFNTMTKYLHKARKKGIQW